MLCPPEGLNGVNEALELNRNESSARVQATDVNTSARAYLAVAPLVIGSDFFVLGVEINFGQLPLIL